MLHTSFHLSSFFGNQECRNLIYQQAAAATISCGKKQPKATKQILFFDFYTSKKIKFCLSVSEAAAIPALLLLLLSDITSLISDATYYHYPQIGSQSVHNQSWLETDSFGKKQIDILLKKEKHHPKHCIKQLWMMACMICKSEHWLIGLFIGYMITVILTEIEIQNQLHRYLLSNRRQKKK